MPDRPGLQVRRDNSQANTQERDDGDDVTGADAVSSQPRDSRAQSEASNLSEFQVIPDSDQFEGLRLVGSSPANSAAADMETDGTEQEEEQDDARSLPDQAQYHRGPEPIPQPAP